MTSPELLITEIFHSLQGETSLSGVPFAFIRLTGCNLRCVYCDSSYAFHGGKRLRISEIIEKIRPYQTKHVLITGGEPLLQKSVVQLVAALNSENYAVSIETHGEVSIAPVSASARIIMDIKTPSSGMCRGGYVRNLPYLKASDEIKFVISSKDDYAWSKKIVQTGALPTHEILFSPAVDAEAMPGTFEKISVQWLAEKILEDRLPVRLQLQTHKIIWGANRKGV